MIISLLLLFSIHRIATREDGELSANDKVSPIIHVKFTNSIGAEYILLEHSGTSRLKEQERFVVSGASPTYRQIIAGTEGSLDDEMEFKICEHDDC